ncbi:MAG: NUDIX hydrolase [bacterium]|nr:NUDIX hydrolase [bacterium]
MPITKKDFYQISLKVILKNDKDEVLILNGHPDGSFAGFYDLPGGRMDEEEFIIPFTQIIKRELREEVGNIKISLNPKPVAIGRHFLSASTTSAKKDLHILYVFFEAKFVGGKIKISDEHDGFRWVNINKIKPIKFFKSGILEGMIMYLTNMK